MKNESLYYVIDYLTNPQVPDPEEGPFLEIHEEDIEIEGADAWQTGMRFKEKIVTPIKIEATPYSGYKGPPHDFFDGSIAFVSPRFLKVLQSEGVDNFDIYPAIVTYRTTGEKHDVFAFNLIGLVSAVDESKSNISSSDGDYKMDSSIEGFSIDLKKAKNFKMFRLAENCMTILVNQQIKNVVEKAGINTFSFVRPEDWTQL